MLAVSADDQELIGCPAISQRSLYASGGRERRGHAGYNLDLDIRPS